MIEDQLQAMADVLANWPANGKPEMSAARNALFISGLIVETDAKKYCKSCGTPQVDYTYCRITPAGQMFLAAMKRPTVTTQIAERRKGEG